MCLNIATDGENEVRNHGNLVDSIFSHAQVITVGYDAPQSSLIFFRYDMWIQRADTNTVKESSGRFWGLVVGDISTQRSTILSIDHSIVHHISKAETPHPINILGSSDNFEGLKLSNLFNLMGLSQKLEHQISMLIMAHHPSTNIRP